MKRTYGSTEIELEHRVYFCGNGITAAAPIFHRANWPINGRTACGLELWDQSTDIGYEYQSVPAKHAVRFGRPCATCWPALRNNGALFKTSRRRDQATQPELDAPKRCKPNDYGTVVHEFDSTADGARCQCGEAEWKTLVDA